MSDCYCYQIVIVSPNLKLNLSLKKSYGDCQERRQDKISGVGVLTFPSSKNELMDSFEFMINIKKDFHKVSAEKKIYI